MHERIGRSGGLRQPSADSAPTWTPQPSQLRAPPPGRRGGSRGPPRRLRAGPQRPVPAGSSVAVRLTRPASRTTRTPRTSRRAPRRASTARPCRGPRRRSAGQACPVARPRRKPRTGCSSAQSGRTRGRRRPPRRPGSLRPVAPSPQHLRSGRLAHIVEGHPLARGTVEDPKPNGLSTVLTAAMWGNRSAALAAPGGLPRGWLGGCQRCRAGGCCGRTGYRARSARTGDLGCRPLQSSRRASSNVT